MCINILSKLNNCSRMIRNNYFSNDERRATAKRNMGAVRRLPTTPAGREYFIVIQYSSLTIFITSSIMKR